MASLGSGADPAFARFRSRADGAGCVTDLNGDLDRPGEPSGDLSRALAFPLALLFGAWRRGVVDRRRGDLDHDTSGSLTFGERSRSSGVSSSSRVRFEKFRPRATVEGP